MLTLLLERGGPSRLIARDTVLSLLGHRFSWTGAAGRAGGVLALVLGFSGAAAAGDYYPPYPPIVVDQTTPNAWAVAATVHQCPSGDCTDLGAEFQSPADDGHPEAAVGYWNLVYGGGGAYAALTYGALGVSSTGYGDDSGARSGAILIVTVPLSGSGTNTVNFDIEGATNLAPNNLFTPDDSFIATANYAVHDASTHALLDSGGVQANECDPTGDCSGRTPVSLPIHLSNSFTINGPVLVYLYFQMGSGANGPLTFVNATGLISMDLAPGVTNGSSGFLSTPGDPHLVPEPATAWLSLAAVAVLARLHARARRGWP